MRSPAPPGDNQPVAVAHYENFPVASWLCPPGIRDGVVAIYHFARTADDLADEGDQEAPQRLEDLRAYRTALQVVLDGRACGQSPRWGSVFERLEQAHLRHHLPAAPLLDLLDAFEQDVLNPVYANRAQLLDYCARSANPIGRLLLHLQGVRDDELVRMSDKICTALQLINFWQDLSVDVPRGRLYIPQEDAAAHGLSWPPGGLALDGSGAKALVASLCDWARQTMHEGARLPMAVGGRMGLELRLVVQGGLRVLERIEQMDYRTFRHRPVLRAWDAAPLFWRALTMRAEGMQAP